MPVYTVTCQSCGKIFTVKRGYSKAIPKYCSHKCVGLAQRAQTLICQHCGKPYTRSGKASRQISKYCSRKCQNAAKKRIAIFVCEYCGQHVKMRPSKAKQRKYCSKECFNKAQSSKVIITCPICKSKFKVKPSQLKRGRGKYCSKECAYIGRAMEFSGSDNPQWGRVECQCITCGKKFFVKQSVHRKGGGKYCSMKCRKLERIECVCEFCGKIFLKLPSQIKQDGYGRFCSQSCRSKYTIRQLHITSPTSIEQALIDELDKRNIPYEFQHPLGSRILDFALPIHKLAIEADGVYWHSLENVIERDARKDAALQSEGWTILRFTGDEIRESPAACINEIVKVLETKKRPPDR